MKPLRNAILSNSDQEILFFLWKFRLATFQAIKARYFPKDSARKAYDRLRKLEQGKFISQEKIPGTANRIWCLGKRGFEFLIGNTLADLKTNRYRPHRQNHDLLASCALLGDWLHGTPKGVKIITEQQLKSVEIPELTKMFPSELEHHPDGIWLFSSGNEAVAVALEVELSAKTTKRYEQVCAFYSSNTAFENVIWIVRSPDHGNQILNASRMHGIPREGIHLFVTLDHFKASLWQSPIRNSTLKGISMAELLKSLALGRKRTHLETGINVGSTRGQFEVKKAPTNPLLDFSLNLENSYSSASKTARAF